MVHYAAQRGSELSYGNAAGPHSESVPADGPPAAKAAATVSASALALHLDCTRTYIGKLEAECVIQRQGGGFPLDQSRVAYLRYLRRGGNRRVARRTPRHAKAKAALLRIHIAEKQRELVPRADVDELIDGIAGVTLTALSGLPARCVRLGDLAIRRRIERVVFEMRTEITNICQRMAYECGEHDLDQRR
jgi:hypothetical protein